MSLRDKVAKATGEMKEILLIRNEEKYVAKVTKLSHKKCMVDIHLSIFLNHNSYLAFVANFIS